MTSKAEMTNETLQMQIKEREALLGQSKENYVVIKL
jgi:hypothetical protein